MNRAARRRAAKVAEKHWRARWHFDHHGLTVIYPGGTRFRFDGV